MTKNWNAILARLKALLMSYGRSSHDAEDLAQEAFVRLTRYELHDRVENPEGFLTRAAQNLSLDAYRASRRRGEQVLLEDAEPLLIDPSPDAEAVASAREQLAKLSKGLATLEPKTRQIFLSHRIDGMSYDEIAQSHRMSVSAVGKHIAKAVVILTAAMEDWDL